MTSDAVEIYRSGRLPDCKERAFVLLAVGVESELVRDGEECVLYVEPGSVHEALGQLALYEQERRPRPSPPPPPRLHSRAWVGCVVYCAVLLGVAYGVGGGVMRLDAFEVGELHAARVQSGEWWRALTALTLHLDPAHIAANLGAGTWFGYLCGRLLGPGTSWMLIVAGAGAANLLEGLLANPAHRAAGASTAVFSALGLMAAYSWRERRSLQQHWAARLSPLVAGIVLLGWTGSEGEHTDVFAHLAGFAIGAALGASIAVPRLRRALNRVPQWLAGALALGSLAAAWACGLKS
jgi:membrane associated rhomboid family serine protease